MENRLFNTVNPTDLFDPKPYGFSHSVAVSSPATFCFIAGQSGGTGEHHTLSGDFRQQVKDALTNLQIVLESHSMTIGNVVKITILIVDHNSEKLQIWGEEIKKVWAKLPLPASTLIPVVQLALPDMLIEVDAIAVKPVTLSGE